MRARPRALVHIVTMGIRGALMPIVRGPSATLTLLAAVGCASLARSRAIKKRARHDLRGGTGTADGGDHNS